jgi:hypothetical protein
MTWMRTGLAVTVLWVVGEGPAVAGGPTKEYKNAIQSVWPDADFKKSTVRAFAAVLQEGAIAADMTGFTCFDVDVVDGQLQIPEEQKQKSKKWWQPLPVGSILRFVHSWIKEDRIQLQLRAKPSPEGNRTPPIPDLCINYNFRLGSAERSDPAAALRYIEQHLKPFREGGAAAEFARTKARK